MSARFDHVVTSGTFSLDGETFDVDNNIWVVGDDAECIVIDAPHSVSDILAVVGDRTVKAIVLTHAHDDHVRVAPALREETVAPIMLHPDDKVLWELTHTDYLWDLDLAGTVVLVGVPTPDMTVPDLPLIDVFGRGGALKSSWYGDCLPSRDFPMLVDLYRQGRLDLDAFVTEEIGIDDVEAAFARMHEGDVLRSVVIL